MSIEVILIPMALAAAAGWAAKHMASQKPGSSVCFETQFRDQTLLQKALRDFNCSPKAMGTQVRAVHGQTSFVFEPDEQGILQAHVEGNLPIEQTQTFLADLHDQYKRLVQQQSYETLIQRAEAKGMVLETEELAEDNSIVLTFTVPS